MGPCKGVDCGVAGVAGREELEELACGGPATPATSLAAARRLHSNSRLSDTSSRASVLVDVKSTDRASFFVSLNTKSPEGLLPFSELRLELLKLAWLP